MLGIIETAIGYCYDTGIIVPQDPQKAVEWYQLAAEKNDSNALHNLGLCYQYGTGVDINIDLAIQNHKRAAALGHTKAMYCLGRLYYSGRSVERNIDEAVNWITRAANKNYAPAQNHLGNIYSDENEKYYNIETSLFWYKKAVEQNDPAAQYNFAQLYHRGVEVRRDEKSAFDLFVKSAEQGNARAQHKVGLFYQYGFGAIQPNRSKAIEWFKKSAAQGKSDSQYMLGVIYRSEPILPENLDESIKWYTLAADQGHHHALNDLAVLYSDRFNYRENREKQYENIKKSADLNNSTGQYNLAALYTYGLRDILAQNPERAFRYYKLSAEKSNIKASYSLARCYQVGFGCDIDLDLSSYYYRLTLKLMEQNNEQEFETEPGSTEAFIHTQFDRHPDWAYHHAVVTSNGERLKGLWLAQPRKSIYYFRHFDMEQIKIDAKLCQFIFDSVKDIPTDEAPVGMPVNHWRDIVEIRGILKNQLLLNTISAFRMPYHDGNVKQVIDGIQDESTKILSDKKFETIFSALYDYWRLGRESDDNENLLNFTKVIASFSKPHIEHMTQNHRYVLCHIISSTLTMHKASMAIEMNQDAKLEHVHQLIDILDQQSHESIQRLNRNNHDKHLISNIDIFIESSLTTFQYKAPIIQQAHREPLEMKRII